MREKEGVSCGFTSKEYYVREEVGMEKDLNREVISPGCDSLVLVLELRVQGGVLKELINLVLQQVVGAVAVTSLNVANHLVLELGNVARGAASEMRGHLETAFKDVNVRVDMDLDRPQACVLMFRI